MNRTGADSRLGGLVKAGLVGQVRVGADGQGVGGTVGMIRFGVVRQAGVERRGSSERVGTVRQRDGAGHGTSDGSGGARTGTVWHVGSGTERLVGWPGVHGCGLSQGWVRPGVSARGGTATARLGGSVRGGEYRLDGGSRPVGRGPARRSVP